MINKCELAIVGGGFMGLALAFTALEKGLKPVVFEKKEEDKLAPVREFGLVWPIGQRGQAFDWAMQSREVWLKLAKTLNFFGSASGSLHLAYHPEDLHVLEEFSHRLSSRSGRYQILTPEETMSLSPRVNPVGLEGALSSNTEATIDPKLAREQLLKYFKRQANIQIEYGCTIAHMEGNRLSDGKRTWEAERIFVCNGADFSLLYPEFFKSTFKRFQLQLLQLDAQGPGWTLGPSLAGGLSLLHYPSFSDCYSLEMLDQRLQKDWSTFHAQNIDVVISQSSRGHLFISDNKNYPPNTTIAEQEKMVAFILEYVKKLVRIPNPRISSIRSDIAAQPDSGRPILFHPSPEVTVINGMGNWGITLAFGLAIALLEQSTPIT